MLLLHSGSWDIQSAFKPFLGGLALGKNSMQTLEAFDWQGLRLNTGRTMVLLHQNVVGQVKSCTNSGEFEGIAWEEMSPLGCWVISNVEDVAGSGQTCIIRWRIQVKLSRGLHVTKHCQLVDDCQTSIIRFSNWRRMIRAKSSKGCMWEILHVRNHCLAKYKFSFTDGGTCGDSSLTWATGVSNPLHVLL